MIDIEDDLQVVVKSNYLAGLDMALGISASVAASQTIKLVRELRRHGAIVTAYLTPNASNFLGLMALEWACGKPVNHSLTANSVHIFRHQLFLIAPATLNLVSEISAGMATNVVTTTAQSLLGIMAGEKKNIGFSAPNRFLMAMAMHSSMLANPLLKQNKKKLEDLGVQFLPPSLEEGKAKLPAAEDICAYVIRAYQQIKFIAENSYNNAYNKNLATMNAAKDSSNLLETKLANPPPTKLSTKLNNEVKQKNEAGVGIFSMKGVRILITAGGTYEKIDDVRVIDNLATGNTGLLLAQQAFYYGATVYFLASEKMQNVPSYLNTVYYSSSDNYTSKCIEIISKHKCHVGIFSAAVSDFVVKKTEGKLDGSTKQQLTLLPQEKTIAQIKKKFPHFAVVAFKLHPHYIGIGGTELPVNFLQSLADDMLSKSCHALVVNGLQSFENSIASPKSLFLRGKKVQHVDGVTSLGTALWQEITSWKLVEKY